ncbi:hypothetical protein [Polymorphobacter sp. PAMC 29334]|uniref:hypothetical protein n=1 Tax=Polymorphobacter sp. PAMC 29334 TaxID=2862331 RepID=UPI001D00BDFC|nr:hypothetical protein [Polymorphobacter sp. PAMC 29334]
MNVTDTARTIISEPVIGPATLHLASLDGTEAELITVDTLDDRAFAALRDPTEFAEVEIAIEATVLFGCRELSSVEMHLGSTRSRRRDMAPIARFSNGECDPPCH